MADLVGETDIPSAGVRESEAEAVMAENPASDIAADENGDGDTSEPVTEAVPESSGEHSLVGERTMGEEGTFATEAEPERRRTNPDARLRRHTQSVTNSVGRCDSFAVGLGKEG